MMEPGYFNRSVNVLLVDDLPDIRELIGDLLNSLEVYSVVSVPTTRAALDAIRENEQRFHVCLFDLGLDDVGRDELFLLNRHGRQIPFIITSSSNDPEKSFDTGKRGARSFVRKGTPDFLGKLVKNINRFSLLNMLCPSYPDCGSDMVARCIGVLLDKSPLHVNEWAREAAIQDRQLRRSWEESLGLNPKHSLCVYHIFSTLFRRIEAEYAIEEGGSTEPQREIHADEYQRFFDYYQLNKSTIDSFIYKKVQSPLLP
jgi:CheY-like chemotaxis protein